jgi:hypothetical protein
MLQAETGWLTGAFQNHRSWKLNSRVRFISLPAKQTPAAMAEG